jgi:Holliday junction resolvase
MVSDWEQAQILTAKYLGGKVVPGSGGGKIKGDVISDNLVVEVKQTKETSISLQRKWFLKIAKQAKDKEYGLAVFFELRGYLFRPIPYANIRRTDWKSIKVYEKSIEDVEIFVDNKTKWVLSEWRDDE